MSTPQEQATASAPAGGAAAPPPGDSTAVGWVRGFSVFAAFLMMMAGLFHAIAGLGALFENQIYVEGARYVFSFDLTAWGWIHLLVGILVLAAGFGVLSGRVWARSLGIALAMVSMVANFLFLPYYPIWSLLIIAFDVLVVWALLAYNREVART